MSKKFKIVVFILLIGIFSIIVIWQYVNKPTKDLSKDKVEMFVKSSEILKKLDNNTASSSEIIDRLIAVEGNIRKISKDPQYITIELGDTTTLSSIICQIDARHKEDFFLANEGSQIAIQGKVTAFTIDEDMGMGNTIQMNFCTLYKNE